MDNMRFKWGILLNWVQEQKIRTFMSKLHEGKMRITKDIPHMQRPAVLFGPLQVCLDFASVLAGFRGSEYGPW